MPIAVLFAVMLLPFRSFLHSVKAATYESSVPQSDRSRLTRKQFAEMKAYVLEFYKGVKAERSFVDEDGGAIDCVVTSTQPGLQGKGGVATPPPAPLAPHFLAAASASCAGGTIPLRRVTLQDLIRAKSVENYLKKSQGEGGAPPVPPQ